MEGLLSKIEVKGGQLKKKFGLYRSVACHSKEGD